MSLIRNISESQIEVHEPSLLDWLDQKYKAFDLKYQHAKRKKDGYYNIFDASKEERQADKAMSLELYELTKKFLSDNKDILSPAEKGIVLRGYIELWHTKKCVLHIRDTDYAAKYGSLRFGRDNTSYPVRNPMLAGFNLKNIHLSGQYPVSLVFLDVNLSGAVFREGSVMVYCHFEDCNLSSITAMGGTPTEMPANLNQGLFRKCDFRHAILKPASHSSSSFVRCILYAASYGTNSGQYFTECLRPDKREYDKLTDFFHKYHLQETKLTPKKVAHALWLDSGFCQKESSRFFVQKRLSIFSLWAKYKELSFNEADVAQALKSSYEMNFDL